MALFLGGDVCGCIVNGKQPLGIVYNQVLVMVAMPTIEQEKRLLTSCTCTHAAKVVQGTGHKGPTGIHGARPYLHPC